MTTRKNAKVTAAQAFTVAAAALATTACGSGVNTGTSSSTSSVAASSSTAARGQYDGQAQQILDSIARGDFNSATAHFDCTMQQKLSPEALASAWAEYQQQFGTYQSHGDPQDVPRADLTVVNIPLKMATLPGEFRVTFHDNDGTVAGLFFLKTGVPVP